MVSIGVFLMKNKISSWNWEKISSIIGGIALLITLWGSLNQSQRDIADLRVKVAKIEIKVET